MIKEIRDKEPDALIVIEAALLSEGHLIPLCDDVWYIYTDEQIRIKRIMESRGYSTVKSVVFRPLQDKRVMHSFVQSAVL